MSAKLSMYQAFLAQDLKLVAAGFPATSAWWKAQIQRFYESGKRQIILRVGRRGGKSSTLARIAVCELLHGDHRIPPGDTGFAIFISVNRDEAAQRLRTVRAILDALGVSHKSRGDEVMLSERPLGFKVFTASISGVSGPTAVFVAGDELAKWSDKETGANPAREVVGSVKPTVATQPNAKLFWSSSAFSQLDYHFELFERGDTEDQMVAEAPTWVANPTVTEAETRKLEVDTKVWLREFCNQPQAAASALLDPDAVARCFEPRTDTLVDGGRVLCIDPSAGKRDAFAFAVIGWTFWDDAERWQRNANGEVCFTPWGTPIQRQAWKPPAETKPYLRVHEVGGWKGVFWDKVSSEQIVSRLATIAANHGTTKVISDQFEAHALRSMFRHHGLSFHEETWSGPSKQTATGLLRRLVSDRRIAFPEHDELRRELLSFEERITSSGHFTYDSKGRHADYLAAILTGLMHETSTGLPRSDIRSFSGDAPRKPINRSIASLGGWY